MAKERLAIIMPLPWTLLIKPVILLQVETLDANPPLPPCKPEGFASPPCSVLTWPLQTDSHRHAFGALETGDGAKHKVGGERIALELGSQMLHFPLLSGSKDFRKTRAIKWPRFGRTGL